MASKEEFIKVWKDSSRESILNQYYYDYKTLREQYDNWNELKEWVKDYPTIHYSSTEKVNGIRLSGKLIREDNLLDKMQEIESRK